MFKLICLSKRQIPSITYYQYKLQIPKHKMIKFIEGFSNSPFSDTRLGEQKVKREVCVVVGVVLNHGRRFC